MGPEDWYRNRDWSADTEAAFRAKLSRSRTSRPQYLRIQASYLAGACPMAALALIDEYFETGDKFDVPNAFCVRAEAYRALGRTGEAIAAYKRALSWEETHPGHISVARTDLPKLVAEARLSSEYGYALEILASRFDGPDHLFPSARYVWNGTCALITHDLGRVVEAREFAERALRAARETQSPFRYHRGIGVVRDTADDFGRRIKRIVRPSRLESLLRLFWNRDPNMPAE
jgi:tetratricopeptide (TPR) repeat protein